MGLLEQRYNFQAWALCGLQARIVATLSSSPSLSDSPGLTVYIYRKALVERAAQLAIRVTNPNARIRSEENE